MEFKFEILSTDRALVGLSYNRGKAYAKARGKEVIFHEVGIGFGFFALFLTFY